MIRCVPNRLLHRSLVCFTAALLLAAGAAWAGPPAPDCCSPNYNQKVMQAYRTLQFKTSTYAEPPAPGQGVRLGIYQAQADCGPGATAKNMDRLEKAAEIAAKHGVQLLAFPELYVPGYTLSPDQAKDVAEFKDGPSITRACNIAKRLNMALIAPYAEKAKDGKAIRVYDSIAVISASGELLFSYRKNQLYGQQERDNWSFGDKLSEVVEINGLPVGVLNCYECEFPELSRILALKGAKLIVGPTAADCYYTLPNGERSSVPYPDISTMLIPAYAYANNLFFAYVNRAGYEQRGPDKWHYRGNSIVAGPYGDIVVAADHQQDTMLVADCIPEYYGMTHPAPDYEYLKDRRPNLYKLLTEPKVDFLKGGYVYPKYKDGKEIR
jgi:predicted amidohydrolase